MAYDAFLKLDGITGESTDSQHVGWIEVHSYSWGVSQPQVAASGRASGHAVYAELVVTKEVDSASPAIIQDTTTGKATAGAILAVRKAGGSQDYLTYTLTSVLIGAVLHTGNTLGGTAPQEEVSLKFSQAVITVAQTVT